MLDGFETNGIRYTLQTDSTSDDAQTEKANPLYPVPVVWGRKDFRRLIESIRK